MFGFDFLNLKLRRFSYRNIVMEIIINFSLCVWTPKISYSKLYFL